MGFKSFVENLKGSKSKDTRQRVSPASHNAQHDQNERPATKNISRRKSFFRNHTDPMHVIPQVPVLKHSRSEFFNRPEPDIELVRTGSVDLMDFSQDDAANSDSPFDNLNVRHQRRQSLSRRLSRRLSMGLFSQEPQEEAIALPPMPAIPAAYNQPARPVHDDAKKKRTSTVPQAIRTRRQSQSHKRRSHIWASSNPDDDDDIPPTPHLIRDNNTPSPQRSPRSTVSLERNGSDSTVSALSSNASKSRPQNSRGHGRSNSNPHHRSKRTSRGSRDSAVIVEGAEAPRPMSSYIPRSAAKGFLNSTTTASEATRKSWRQSSFYAGKNGPVVCLTDEHMKEWERLKFVMNAVEGRTYGFDGDDEDAPRELADAREREKALNALEFGLAR